MILLHLLLMISGELAEPCSVDNRTAGIVVNLTSKVNEFIIINDVYSEMVCIWVNGHCYAECKPLSLTVNLTTANLNTCQIMDTPGSPTGQINFNILSSECKVIVCEVNPIKTLVEEIKDLTSPGLTDLRRILNIRNMCENLFAGNLMMKKLFMAVELYIIHSIINVSLPGGPVSYNLRDLALTVVTVNMTNQTNVNNSMLLIKAPELLPENQTYIPETWLPVNAFWNIPEEERKVGVVTYKLHNQFLFEKEDVSSMVIRIEIAGGRRLVNLTTPVAIKFSVMDPMTPLHHNLICHYFDECEKWQWVTDGCVTSINRQPNQTLVECSCNHTTPFSVLLIRGNIDKVHWEILSYISYIGCGLSAFFTLISLLIYVLSRSTRTDDSNTIHVSLSGALFLLNTSFLLSEWGATLNMDWVCVFIAVTMHYSLLSCFTWMAIEAVHLYLLLVKVFNTYYRHYVAKLSLIGWGVPGVLVGVSLVVKDVRPFYGAAEITLSDTNKTNTICWIIDLPFFYGINLVYFTLIFLINSGVLLSVTSRICHLKRYGSQGKQPLNCRDICTVLSLTCLLGTTWGLAFLGYGHTNYPILYVFSIFNSLQGFFIFLWICGTARKEKQRVANTKLTSGGAG